MSASQIPNYSLDWQYWDNTEAVTVSFRRSNAAEEDTEIEIATALREDLDRREASYLGVQISSDSTVWNVPCSLLVESTEEGEVVRDLREGDRIADAESNIWIVISAMKERVGNAEISWRAVCSKA